MGNNPPLELLLGTYNALSFAPHFSRGYVVILKLENQYDIKFLPPPINLKGNALVLIEKLNELNKDSFSFEDIQELSNYSKSYLFKLLKKLERKGYISSIPGRYNKKAYFLEFKTKS